LGFGRAAVQVPPDAFLSLALAKKTDGSAPDGEKTADYLGSKINALYRTDDV
jgi:hypothetical protein